MYELKALVPKRKKEKLEGAEREKPRKKEEKKVPFLSKRKDYPKERKKGLPSFRHLMTEKGKYKERERERRREKERKEGRQEILSEEKNYMSRKH